MTTEFELENFSNWLYQPQQADAAAPHRLANMAKACERLDMDEEEILEALDPDETADYGLISLDNCVCAPCGDAQTFGEVYLKKRGWKDSALNRAYIEAVLAAPLRLYRIAEASAARIRVVHVFDPAETIAVDNIEEFDFLPGDLVATRVLQVRGKTRFASGILYFPSDELDRIAAYLDGSRAELAGAADDTGGPLPLPTGPAGLLAAAPFVIVNFWLEQVFALPDDGDVEPPEFTYDGEAVEHWKLVYDIADGVSADAVTEALFASPDFAARTPTVWALIDPAVVPEPDMGMSARLASSGDSAEKLATVMVRDGFLYCHANSASRRVRLREALARCGQGLWTGPAVETPETFEDFVADLKFHAERVGGAQ
jgi:hypothetical protein